ncbi:MAG: TetR/AcrR family transcriptional regulator [Ruegeria sp.]
MVQRLKPEVRDRILTAAAESFAEQGYATAALAQIAKRAGTATSNLYKYFDNKQTLFEAVVTPQLAARLLRLLRARLREFTLIEQWDNADARGSAHARALLAFWVEHRCVTLILLRGADGTRYAHVRTLMIAEMQRQATEYLSQTGQTASPEMHHLLHCLFHRTTETIADILLHHQDPAAIERSIGLFWRYQLAGLQALLNPPRG